MANKKETFVIEVQYQQNATWQGTIEWLNKKKTRNFRSALEMLKLMEEALGEEEEEKSIYLDK